KEAFAGESQANRRYLYFARRADIEGDSETAGLFRDTAEGETGHAFGHMDFLAAVGDPATDEPVGDSEKNLVSAVAGETYEFTATPPTTPSPSGQDMISSTQITTDHQSYAERRAAERARVMPIRAERRVHLGDMLVFEFENDETLRYQVQEMIFVERITDPAEV